MNRAEALLARCANPVITLRVTDGGFVLRPRSAAPPNGV